MLLFTSPATLDFHLKEIHTPGVSLSLVPTMGALHNGHLELVKRSVSENALTIASIFVNPLQFNSADDLIKYPRTLDADCAMLENAGCDLVFAPSPEEMYAQPTMLKLDFGELERVMEGAFRPGHFSGVGIVVARLFNMVQPDRAYFGQKDLQQVAVVRRLVEDFAFSVDLVACATVRETDGLAMSSRNRRLSPPERALAPLIFRTLNGAKDRLMTGQPKAAVKQFVREQFARQPEFQLEYFEVADASSLQLVDRRQPEGQTALCVAANLGEVRLIDNVVF